MRTAYQAMREVWHGRDGRRGPAGGGLYRVDRPGGGDLSVEGVVRAAGAVVRDRLCSATGMGARERIDRNRSSWSVSVSRIAGAWQARCTALAHVRRGRIGNVRCVAEPACQTRLARSGNLSTRQTLRQERYGRSFANFTSPPAPSAPRPDLRTSRAPRGDRHGPHARSAPAPRHRRRAEASRAPHRPATARAHPAARAR